MSLYKKKNSRFWYAQVYVARLGKALSFSTGKEERAEAEEVERAFRNAQNRNIEPEKIHAIVDTLYGEGSHKKKGLRLVDAFDRYKSALETAGKTTIPRTLSYKRTVLNRLIAWIDSNNPAVVYIGELSRTIAGRFAEESNSRDDISDKTKHETITALGTVWNVLMGVDETIKENPWRFFNRRVVEKKIRQAFTPDEERRIFSACVGTEWHTASHIARFTGLRRGDIVMLKWGDVDFDKRLIRIVPNKTKQHGIKVTIPLVDKLYMLLCAKCAVATEDLILPMLNAAYPHMEKLPFGTFTDVLREAGVDTESHTFHSWRHTFRTRLSEAGVSDDLAKRLGGWTCDNTAMRYDHAERIDEMRAAVEKTDLRVRG